MPKETILFDMDGVLFDFEKHFRKVIGKKSTFSPDSNNIGEYDLVGRKFFTSMPILKEGADLLKDLHSEGYTIHILSSTGGQKHGKHKEVKEQKLKALSKANFPISKTYFVDAAAKKVKYSKQGILIDDKEKTVKSFNTQGGTAFLFTPNKAQSIFEQITALREELGIQNFSDYYFG